MLRGWKRGELGDVLTFQRGFDLPQRDRQEGNIPIVSSSGISGYHYLAKVHGPGVVTGRYGTLGQVFYIKKDFWPLNTTLFVREFKGNDPLFLSYFLRTLNLANQNAAGAVPGLNRNALHLLPVCIPPFPTQRKIAAILSAYDNLIENNTRRIAILENMAQALYREWFVHFRFPGYEKKRMVESVLGMIPEGWEVVKLGDVAQEIRRNINPELIDPETPYFGLEHFPRRSIALASWGTAKEVQSTKLVFKEGEILFGKIRPYFHKVGVAPLDGVCSTDTIVISPRTKEYSGLVLCCVSSDEFVNYATLTSQGTKMPRANWDVLVKYPVVIPPKQMLLHFDTFVQNIMYQIQNLIFRNRNLRCTRDLLLPRLISGEVDVEGLDIETGEGMTEAPASIEEDVKKSAEVALAGEQMPLWG
ncbi:MAG: restriction endonuclease subunit S [Ktedonobacteraceae bacterium]